MFLSLSSASYFLLSGCGFGLTVLRSFLLCVCEGGGLCLGVCQGAHIEIGGNHLGVGSLLSPCVLRRLELRLRPAGASAVTCQC